MVAALHSSHPPVRAAWWGTTGCGESGPEGVLLEARYRDAMRTRGVCQRGDDVNMCGSGEERGLCYTCGSCCGRTRWVPKLSGLQKLNGESGK